MSGWLIHPILVTIEKKTLNCSFFQYFDFLDIFVCLVSRIFNSHHYFFTATAMLHPLCIVLAAGRYAHCNRHFEPWEEAYLSYVLPLGSTEWCILPV